MQNRMMKMIRHDDKEVEMQEASVASEKRAIYATIEQLFHFLDSEFPDFLYRR